MAVVRDTEQLINTTPGGEYSHFAFLANGGYVAIWTNRAEVRGRVFDAAGNGAPEDFLIAVPARFEPNMYSGIGVGDVAALPNGGFIVTWLDTLGNGTDVRARTFDANGEPLGAPMIVNNSPGYHLDSSVTLLASGNVLVIWQNGMGDTEVSARLLDSSGAKIGSEFLVNTTTAGAQGDASVAALRTGGFVVSWRDAPVFGDGDDTIRAQLFDEQGSKYGPELIVNTSTTGRQESPTVAALDHGGFVVAWQDSFMGSDGSGTSIKAQLYDVGGSKIGGEFIVNANPAGNQSAPALAQVAGVGFVVAWHDQANSGDVESQVFSTDGTRIGPEWIASDSVAGQQWMPDVAGGPNGKFVLGWTDGGSVKGRTYQASPDASSQTITGTAGADYLPGGAAEDQISGQGGNDNIVGGGGSDNLSGGDGDDYLQGDSGNNFYDGGAGNDSLNGGDAGELFYGGAGNDIILGNGGNDLQDGGEGDDSLVGGDGNDRLLGQSGTDQLTGGAGDDVLNGGTGGDYMHGGTGNDLFFIDHEDDATVEGVGEGTDLVRTSMNHSIRPNVENVTYTGTGFVYVQGNELGNVINASSSSQALVVANGGDDTVTGGAGNDNIAGGDGLDTLVGGAGDDYLQGDAGNNTLIGDAGNDSLNGGNESEALYGGIGDDILLGNGGEDYLDGGAGNDRIIGGTGDDVLLGQAGTDQLTGGDGNDTLNGGTGGDYMHGGLGNDIFHFDHAGDDSVEGAGEGTDLVRTTINHNLRPNVENVTFTGIGAVYVQGNELSNVIDVIGSSQAVVVANEGNDTVTGGPGNDNIAGGAGDDTLNGGAGDDYLQGDAGANVLNGGSGNDSLNGGEDAETLLGGIGNDNMLGNGGNDRLEGGSGDDKVNGGAGDDLLFGQAGADTIHGGAGADMLNGGASADYMEGGAGADRYVYDADAVGTFTDTIFGFSKGEGDQVDLSAVDADTTTAGNQAFTYIGSAAFTGTRGEFRVEAAAWGGYFAEGDVNGDGVADVRMYFQNPTDPIDQGDFIF